MANNSEERSNDKEKALDNAISRVEEGFGKGAQWFADQNELEAALRPHLGEGTNVLIKASRFMGLDKLAKRIEGHDGKGKEG